MAQNGDGTSGANFQVNTTLLEAGAALILLGLGLFGGALAAGLNKWVNALETPPQETAKQYLNQLQNVYSAGQKAWKENMSSNSDEPDEILYRRVDS